MFIVHGVCKRNGKHVCSDQILNDHSCAKNITILIDTWKQSFRKQTNFKNSKYPTCQVNHVLKYDKLVKNIKSMHKQYDMYAIES